MAHREHLSALERRIEIVRACDVFAARGKNQFAGRILFRRAAVGAFRAIQLPPMNNAMPSDVA